MCLNLNDWNWSCEHTFSFKAWGHVPLSESDLSEDMVEPWLSFLILSEPLCSCSSRTLSSLCSQRRRPFICSARSSCSCSFWKVKAQKFNLNPALKKKDRNVVCCLRGGRCCSEHCAFTPTVLCVPLCGAGPVSAGWGWCSSLSQMTEELAFWAAPGSASVELVCKSTKATPFNPCRGEQGALHYDPP